MTHQFPFSQGIALIIAIFTLSACTKDTSNTKELPITPPVTTASEHPLSQKSGQALYARCRACHTLNKGGRHKVGPNLWQIIGRKAGNADGYAYSKAMIASDIIWSEETLSAYIENPAKFLPKNKMAFAGLRQTSDRDALIAYLKGNTTPPH